MVVVGWVPAPAPCPPPSCPQVWSHYEETPVEEVVPVLEEKERTANYKPVFVTEITDDLHFYVQDVETGEGVAGRNWGGGHRGAGVAAPCPFPVWHPAARPHLQLKVAAFFKKSCFR